MQDLPCTPGATFKKGDALRLQHTATRKWLHSHGFHSPLTQNQEVSAYGSDTESDGGMNHTAVQFGCRSAC